MEEVVETNLIPGVTEEGDFFPARAATPSSDEVSSDDDQISKAFKSLKRSREEKMGRKKQRIRKPVSSSDEETEIDTNDQTEYFKIFDKKEKSVVRRILSSDEEDSDKDKEEDSDDSFINDDDDSDDMEDGEGEGWAEMMAGLSRRDEKYQGLTSQYEEAVLDNRVTGGRYDVSDDEEERVNKYPEKLIVCLREAVVDAHKDDRRDPPEEVDNNDQLVQMWEMYDYREDKEKDGECVCGQTGLRHLFLMRIKQSDNWQWHTRIVGSECIKWFIKSSAHPNLGVMFKLLKDGVIATFENRLASKCLQFSLGGNILPPVLLQHKNDHALDYKLPIKISDSDVITMVVSPSTSNTRDDQGKQLKRGEKYRVFSKPSFKPTKDLFKIPTVDFILVKVVNLAATKSETTSTSHYKPENYIKN